MHGGLLDAEMEVELPGADVLRSVTILVCKCDADLYDLQQVNIAPHSLVVIVRRSLERADWPSDDARELRVLAQV